MQFGLSIFITDETITPVALGRAAEDAGFESLFVPEHTHIPASRESAWSGGDELPPEYSHTLDPFVSLGAMAYSLYLWHWPLLIFWLAYSGHPEATFLDGAVILLVAGVLAWLTTRYVEEPLLRAQARL